MPTREEVEQQLISVLAQIQELSGREVPKKITVDLCPMLDLDGFESINAAEATAILAADLRLKIKDIPFFPKAGQQPLTIAQIADNILKAESAK
jgi:hypothetical protein